MEKKEIKGYLEKILSYIGEDPQREGLSETPDRILKSWEKIFGGYDQKPEDILKVFSDKDSLSVGQIVLLKNTEFFSTCEHHFLPFTGKAHLAYIPQAKVLGISKLARVLEIYARRLQIQERIGNQVTDALMKIAEPTGAACIIEATHHCMACRGVEKTSATMVTSSLKGEFLKNPKSRQELMSLIKG